MHAWTSRNRGGRLTPDQARSTAAVICSPGRLLDPATRAWAERGFGYDFARVRIHADAKARRSAGALGARAYTVSRHVVLGTPAPSPTLLAHELAHVAQKGGEDAEPQPLSAAPGPLEDDADQSAAAALRGEPARPRLEATPGSVQRQLGGALEKAGSEIDWAALFGASLTLDGFASGDATLIESHMASLAAYKPKLAQLLSDYPDSFVSVVGHTDATHTEARNEELELKRANAVMAELTRGENAVPTTAQRASSMGERTLKVETKEREPRNLRVEIMVTARRFSYRTPPVFTLSQPWVGGIPPIGPGPFQPGTGIGSGPGPGPGGGLLVPPAIPPAPAPPGPWLEEALKKDPLIRKLPDFGRDKVIDALKDGDEMLADKIINSVPLGDKEKAAIKAVVKSLLQMATGKKFTVPTPPHYQLPPSIAPEFPKAPGEVVVPGPKWEW